MNGISIHIGLVGANQELRYQVLYLNIRLILNSGFKEICFVSFNVRVDFQPMNFKIRLYKIAIDKEYMNYFAIGRGNKSTF